MCLLFLCFFSVSFVVPPVTVGLTCEATVGLHALFNAFILFVCLFAAAVVYDFEANSDLAALLETLLQQNPSCCCLLAHCRRLGIVCPTSSVPVDVFAEDFWDRFCSVDPGVDPTGDPTQDQARDSTEDYPTLDPTDDPTEDCRRLQLYLHPAPPLAVTFAGIVDPKHLRATAALLDGSPARSEGILEGSALPRDEKELHLIEQGDNAAAAAAAAATAAEEGEDSRFSLRPWEVQAAAAKGEIWEVRLKRSVLRYQRQSQ